MMRHLAGLAVALGLVAAGCAQPALQPRANPRALPRRVVPATLDGYRSAPVPAARQAFASVGASSAAAKGQVWTLSLGKEVVGALEVAELKGGLTTASEVVKAGIRSAINNGYYRWFKVLGAQWVGVQLAPALRIYLWLPPRKDIYEVLQLALSVPRPQQLVTKLIAYQEGKS